MKCEYCNGKGTYDPFTGPTAECPKCKGTGQVGSTDECNDSHPVWKNAPGVTKEEFYTTQQLDSLKAKLVVVTFHPILKTHWVEGNVIETEMNGPHLHRIKLSEGGYIHDIKMRDVAHIRCAASGALLWPADAPKYVTIVSTTIAGTAVKTGDKVEVHARNLAFTWRASGILTKIGAVDIEVESAHGVETIPINTIDRLIVSFGVTGATHVASYPNLPAWAHTKKRLGQPRGLGPASFPFMPSPNRVSRWIADDVDPVHDSDNPTED